VRTKLHITYLVHCFHNVGFWLWSP